MIASRLHKTTEDTSGSLGAPDRLSIVLRTVKSEADIATMLRTYSSAVVNRNSGKVRGGMISTPASLEDTESALVKPNGPDVGFVACIEGGVLERQALLLFESIRFYGGRFRECAIYALSPRAGHGISQDARCKLDKLGVYYIDAILNMECLEYGPANRVAAAAYIER